MMDTINPIVGSLLLLGGGYLVYKLLEQLRIARAESISKKYTIPIQLKNGKNFSITAIFSTSSEDGRWNFAIEYVGNGQEPDTRHNLSDAEWCEAKEQLEEFALKLRKSVWL